MTKKLINLIVTGGIASCKAKKLYSLLNKNYTVNLILTKNALRFDDYSNLNYHLDLFDPNIKIYPKNCYAQHLKLTKNVDLNIIYPASYNFIGKISSGLVDDLASSIYSASDCFNFIFPSMNSVMYLNPILQKNKAILLKCKNNFWFEPKVGKLANGEIGLGRALEPKEVFEIVKNYFNNFFNLKNKNVLLNFGRTRCYIDKVRYISNSSSGKMGLAFYNLLKLNCKKLISIVGDVDFDIKDDQNTFFVKTNQEMLQLMKNHFLQSDIVICNAALNDFEIENKFENKIEKNLFACEKLNLTLKTSVDVLCELQKIKTHQYIIGFSLANDFDLTNAWNKLNQKNLDMLIVNLTSAIESNYNQVKILIAKSKKVINIQEAKKSKIVFEILKVVNQQF